MIIGNKAPVNIIIQDHVIRYVDSKDTSLRGIRNFGERYIHAGLIREGKIVDNDSVETILEECVSEWKLKHRQVKFIVPEATLFFRKLSIPADIRDEEIKNYLYFEHGTSIHLPFDDPVFDFHVLGVAEDKKEILLFASPEQVINEYATLFENVGLEPIVADVSALTAYRLLHSLEKVRQEDHTMVVHYGIGSIVLSIFHDHKPVFLRHIRVSSDEKLWNRQLGENSDVVLSCEDEEAVREQVEDYLDEIERNIDFYKFSVQKEANEVQMVVLTGDHPMLAYIEDELRKKINIDIYRFQDGLVEAHRTEVPGRYILPLGLSLKGV